MTSADRGFALVAALALTVGLRSHAAHATQPPKPPDPAGIGRALDERGIARLYSEDVTFECDKDQRCTVTVVWTFEPTIEVTTARATLRRGTVQGLMQADAAVPFVSEEVPMLEHSDIVEPEQTIRFEIEASEQRQTIMLTAVLVPVASRPGGAATPMLETRHVFLSRPKTTISVYYGSQDTVAPPAMQTIQMTLPNRFEVSTSAGSHSQRTGRGQTDVTVDGVHALGSFDLSDGAPHFGGGFLGLGAGFVPHEAARFRLRGGWETGSLPWIAHGASVDTDFQQVFIVPYTDIGSPSFFAIAPSVSIGLGVPVRVYPDPRVGIRVQSQIAWSFFAIFGALDILPPMAGQSIQVQGSVFGQFSF